MKHKMLELFRVCISGFFLATIFANAETARLAAGDNHAFYTDRAGNVWAWGYNDSGQIGNGTNLVVLSPERLQTISGISCISPGDHHSIAVKEDGSVWAGAIILVVNWVLAYTLISITCLFRFLA